MDWDVMDWDADIPDDDEDYMLLQETPLLSQDDLAAIRQIVREELRLSKLGER